MTALVTFKNIFKQFGKLEAVRDVSFTLRGGETIALVGHNGAGKTTLMKLMLGLIHPNAGTIDLMGSNPAQRGFAGREKLGYLPENIAFNIALTGRETLAFYARLKRRPVEDVEWLLALVGLTKAADKRVGTYSKGMRQRLGLAQALLGKPRILLLDEPTTGLDPALRQTFYDIVQKLRDGGSTILLSSHALTELEGQADRVIIMNRGQKVADGSMDELRHIASLPIRIRMTFENPAHALRLPPGVMNMPLRHLTGNVVEISPATGDKLQVLKSVLESDNSVTDIDIIQPTLDELYAHFLQAQENRA